MHQPLLRACSRLLVIAMCATLIPFLCAEDIYVAQIARGAGTGHDAANAHSVAFFNMEGNWHSPAKKAGKIGPGDTVHLVGTISDPLTIQASGAAGKPITILFDRGAKMSAPYWSGAAIKISRRDYITIDGGAVGLIGGYDGRPELANGVIECTDNGTQLGHQMNSSGIGATECRNLTVKNLVIANMYVRAGGTEQKDYGIGVYNADVNGRGIVDYRVTNCIIHDAYIGINSDYGDQGRDYEFSYNTLYHCNWGAKNSDRGSKTNTMSGLVVHHNWFHDWKNWDDPAKNSFHHNGFFAWANQGTLSEPIVHSNVFGPGFGGRFQTAAIYINTGIIEPLIYNNLFLPGPGEGVGNGFITVDSQRATTLRIYNNSLISPTGTGTFLLLNGNAGHQVVEIKNNLCVGAASFIAAYNRTNLTLHSDYNLGFSLGLTSAFKLSSNSSAAGNTIAEWLKWGYDAHGVFADPRLDSAYRPLAGSPAINAGADLSAFFTLDRAGIARPKGKPWTIGASLPAAPAATPPSVRSAPSDQTVSAGTTVTLSVSATGSPAPTFQWYRNGTALSGQTGASLKLSSVTVASAGTYTVVVKNSAGSVTSKGAVLTVIVPPAFTTQPTARTLAAGATATFTAVASGTPAPTYQWLKNGTALSGQTGATLKLTGITTASAGTYAVVAKNSAGSVTSKGAALTVTAPPVFTTQPTGQTVTAGATVTFVAAASGAPSPAYQWKKDGAVLSGATSVTLTLSGVTSTQSGSYTVVATNAAGSATSNAAVLTVKAATVSPPPQTTPVTGADSGSGQVTTPPATTTPGRFANLSVRAAPGTDSSSLIVGFVAASAKKRILVRAVGPGLEAMTHLKTFADPQLTLYAGSVVMANNAKWGGTPLLRDTFTAVGAFPLDNKSMDAAILSTLVPQAYTAVVSGTGTGVVLAEIYDADSAPTSTAGRLVNLSARAHVGTGDNVLIAGFVIAGSSPVKVLIRAVGPSLSKVGVSGALVDPLLELYRGETRLTQNDNWGGSSTLTAAFTQTGAFGLANASSKDAAILVTLDPGAYTAVVSGVKGTTGNALVEAYEVR